MNLESEKKIVEEKIGTLKDENKTLSGRLNRYRQDHYSGDDFLDSGYIKPGEKVIVFSGSRDTKVPLMNEETGGGRYSSLLPYLRIVWVAISVALVACLYLYNRTLKRRETS